MEKVATWIVVVAGIIAFAAVVGLVFSLPVMWLWNGCLVPAVTFAKPIGWLQSWGLLILAGLLIKSPASSSN